MFTLWALIGDQLYRLTLEVPRIFYVNCYVAKQLAGEGQGVPVCLYVCVVCVCLCVFVCVCVCVCPCVSVDAYNYILTTSR